MQDNWTRMRFGDIVRFAEGLVDPREQPYSGMVHLGPDNIAIGGARVIGKLMTAEELKLISGKYLFDARAIVYSKIRPNLNKVCIPGFEGICSADMYPIWANEMFVDAKFLCHVMRSPVFVRSAVATSTRTGMPKINRVDLMNLLIDVPTKENQHRITETLDIWDDAVEKTSRLIQVKNQFIRGMLAECVSDGREIVSHDGWEKTTIGEVATLAQRRVTWDESATYQLITVKRGCGGLVFRGDRKGHEILTKDMYTARAGDFLISKRQVVHGAWAMVLPEFDGAHVSKEYACLRAKPDKLWMPYFDWLSRTERLQHEAFICSYGVDIEKMVLNVEWLLQTPLLLPRSIETQKAMAAGLDCLQREVQLLQAQMEALGRQKRGLMQKLLTGEWRVPVRDRDVDAITARVTEEAAQ
jgi:type I restriction enzyme S subunit